MPGPITEYLGNSETERAVSLIDNAIQQGQGGNEIISMLDGAGLRLYPAPEAAQDEIPPTEGMPPEDLTGEPPMEGEEALPPEMAAGLEGPQEPRGGGGEGGMRDMRIAAVRFALDKDKKNKSAQEAEER